VSEEADTGNRSTLLRLSWATVVDADIGHDGLVGRKRSFQVTGRFQEGQRRVLRLHGWGVGTVVRTCLVELVIRTKFRSTPPPTGWRFPLVHPRCVPPNPQIREKLPLCYERVPRNNPNALMAVPPLPHQGAGAS
jgi:hypothetical protein